MKLLGKVYKTYKFKLPLSKIDLKKIESIVKSGENYIIEYIK